MDTCFVQAETEHGEIDSKVSDFVWAKLALALRICAYSVVTGKSTTHSNDRFFTNWVKIFE